MSRRGVHLLLCLSVAGSLVDSRPVTAEKWPCDDVYLSTDAQSEYVADLVCEAAVRAKAFLQSCGLVQTSAINIEVVESAIHPGFGECMALFDKRTGCLQVTDPGRLPLLLPENDARAALPPDILFASTITHELAHALLHQSAGAIAVGPTEQEFVANAMEMAVLDPHWRDVLLGANPAKPGGSVGLINQGIYALAPRVFANNAWQYFQREEIGCALVQKIAAGQFRFPVQ
jgi:hypothetical protein